MKRIVRYALMAVLMLLPLTAAAFTTRDLSNVAWIATYRTNPNFNPTKDISPITDSHGVTAERIDDTHIRFNGIQGCLDFIFTLTDASGNADPDGDYLCIATDTYAVNVSAQEYADQQWNFLPCSPWGYGYDDYYTFAFWYQLAVDTKTLFHITKNGENFKMQATGPVYVQGTNDQSSYDAFLGSYIRIFDDMELESFVPNAWMSDRYYELYNYSVGYGTEGSTLPSSITAITPYSPERLRTYPVRVEMDYTNNRFSILNFGNNGYGIREDKKYYRNLLNSNITTYADGKFIISGSINPDTRQLVFDKRQFAKPFWAMFTQYGNEDNFDYQLERLDLTPGAVIKDELFGTYEEAKGVHHNNAENGWVSHGGKRRTFEDLSIEIEPYTYYLNQLLVNRLNFESGYYDSYITNGDVTLQTEYVREPSANTARVATSDPLAHISYTQFTAGNDVTSPYYDGTKEWGIVPVMNVIRNEKYVDSYEIMAVPGSYTTAAEVQEHINEAVDFRRVFLNDGTQLRLTDGKPVFKADELKNGLYKPGDFRIARATNGGAGEPYTFFIKANYRPETSLTPTYHDVYPYVFFPTIPTAADIIENGAFEVEGTQGALIISEADADVTVYDIAGRTVYVGRDSRVELPAGFYIAKCGRSTRKVQVR